MNNMGQNKKSLIKELKEHPVKILGLVYPYILVVGVGLGMLYLSKINDIGRNKFPPASSDSVYEFRDLKLIEPSSNAKANVTELSEPNPALIAKGKSLFTTNCIACHGVNGKGDGPAAASLNPKPRNFTSKANWINGPKISGIYKTLSEGIKGSAMVAFGTFSPQDKFALAQYIRSTFVPNPPEDTKEDLENLEQTYNLAQGSSSPGQIPIKDAMLIFEKNSRQKYDSIMFILNQIKNDPGDNGAAIFKRVTNNEIRALTTLSNTGEWHNNEQAFVNLIVNELNEDGFNDNVHSLTSSEWNTFFKYMSNYFSE